MGGEGSSTCSNDPAFFQMTELPATASRRPATLIASHPVMIFLKEIAPSSARENPEKTMFLCETWSVPEGIDANRTHFHKLPFARVFLFFETIWILPDDDRKFSQSPAWPQRQFFGRC